MQIKSLFIALGLTLTLGLSGITSNTIAAPSTKPTSSTILDDYKKPPSFLFVLQAKEAVLKPVKDDPYRYTLSMALSDDNLNKIIAFSDRPYRIVEMMTAKQLQDLWGEGTNSFKADPPNAVLSASGVDVSIVILESSSIDNNVLTYSLVKTDQSVGATLKETILNQVILTIDHVCNAGRDYNCKLKCHGATAIECHNGKPDN